MKTSIRTSNVFAGNIFVYQLFVENVCTYLLLKNGNKKSREKKAVKKRNWTDDEKTFLCEILVDPMNEFKLFVIIFNLNCLEFLTKNSNISVANNICFF